MTAVRRDRKRERLLVVGGGMAGLRFLEELVAIAPGRHDIVMIGSEPRAPYNRVLLSSLLAGEIGGADVAMRPAEWFAEHDIALVAGTRVTAIDTAARRVATARGDAFAYDVAVLATGSDPIRLDIPGAGLAGVHTFRTLADVEGLDEVARAGGPAVVIGGGLLGIEAACALAARGTAVTLVHLMGRLMERQLDTEGARLLADAVSVRGVEVVLGAQTRAIVGNGEVEAVELADGRHLPCRAVVMALGIRPSTQLARQCGIAVGRGILVDDQMRTSVQGVYAIGECAEHAGVCQGLVEPCYEQARVAAAAIGGAPQRYAGSVSAASLKVSGVPVFSAGDFEGAGAEAILVRDGGRPSYRKLIVREGRLAGAVLVGDTEDALWYRDLIRSQAPVAPIRAALAFGQSFAEAA
jgi:nitrite reductase (NADH) large subunit